jgi:hypothetical protein
VLTTRERQDSKEALTTGPTPCVAIPRTFWLSDISQRLQQTRIAAAAPKPTSMNDTMVHEQMLLTLPTLSLLQAQCHVVCAAQRPVEEGSATCPPLLQALHCCWDWRGSGAAVGCVSVRGVAQSDKGLGVSALPEVRAREGWGGTSGLPTLCIRSVLSEELI